MISDMASRLSAEEDISTADGTDEVQAGPRIKTGLCCDSFVIIPIV